MLGISNKSHSKRSRNKKYLAKVGDNVGKLLTKTRSSGLSDSSKSIRDSSSRVCCHVVINTIV